MAFDQEISGFPIKKGSVQLTEKGNLKEGICAQTIRRFGQTIPSGALISLWNNKTDSYYIGTEDKSFIIDIKTGEVEEFDF